MFSHKNSPIPTILGKRVKAMRERHGFTQGELADRSDCSTAAISRIEAGLTIEPGRMLLQGIATALGVSVDYLLGKDAPEKAPPKVMQFFKRLSDLPPELQEECADLAIRLCELAEKRVAMV